MKMNRLSSIGLAACIALVATMIAMTLVVHSADAQWHSLFGVLVRRIAAAFTPPPTWNSAGTTRGLLAAQLYGVGYVASGVLFALLFWLRTTSTPRRPRALDTAMLALQLLLGVTVETNLLYLFAAELAIVLPLRRAVRWFAALVLANLAQSIAILAAVATNDQAAQYGLLQLGLTTMFFFFAFGVATLAMLEQRAREQLSASHAELQATQALLSDTVRASERLRIARDLHDSIGHHLTALNLHLDLAERQLGGGNESLATARTLSHDLLTEVRAVVSAERGDQRIDLRQSLQALCDGIPAPAIRLEIPDGALLTSPAAAHAVFNCIQEAVSNALRHAQATRLTVAVRRQDAGWTATVSDDGRGAGGRREGNGLTGMRERLRPLGGTLAAGDLPGGGFQVELQLPAAGLAP